MPVDSAKTETNAALPTGDPKQNQGTRAQSPAPADKTAMRIGAVAQSTGNAMILPATQKEQITAPKETIKNQQQKEKNRKREKKKKENHNQIRILYANVNGVRGKIISLQAAADSQNSHIVAITETKGTPPALEGYAPWYHRLRSEGDGGGVAITVRNDINQNTQLVDDLENNNNQEIIWIQINLNRRNKIWWSRERDVTTKSTND